MKPQVTHTFHMSTPCPLGGEGFFTSSAPMLWCRRHLHIRYLTILHEMTGKLRRYVLEKQRDNHPLFTDIVNNVTDVTSLRHRYNV